MDNYENQPIGEDLEQSEAENQNKPEETSSKENTDVANQDNSENYFGNDFNTYNQANGNVKSGFDGYSYAGGDLYENPKSEKKGLGIASMVLGIVSIVCCCMGGYAIICSILAIIFAAIRMKIKADGFAIAGLITGIIGLLFNGGILILYIAGLEEYIYEYMNELESYQSIVKALKFFILK